ncbi:MAG TPA: EF-hand domain-containing protein [Polyangia bacterium]|nr:EF-hand domain-containing protein [Polyangia bacterium]
MNKNTLKLTLGAAGLAICLGGAAFAHDVDTKFQMMDTNGDGKISRDEHTAGSKKMFEKMDTNGDGKVTVAEMSAFHDKMETHEKIESRDHNAKAAKGEMSAADKLKMIDTNGDGVISADEHAAASSAMFDKMDTDHDGFLTKAELKAGHEQMMMKK